MYISIHNGFEYNWQYGDTASKVLTALLGADVMFITNRGCEIYPDSDIFLVDAKEEDIIFPAMKAGIPIKILPG